MIKAAWSVSAMACEGPKASSLDHMSLTLTGWLVTLSGGSFGGEMKSRIFCQKTLPGDDCQSISMRDVPAPRAMRGANPVLNHSLRFSVKATAGVKTFYFENKALPVLGQSFPRIPLGEEILEV